jgi:hypothetical protein
MRSPCGAILDDLRFNRKTRSPEHERHSTRRLLSAEWRALSNELPGASAMSRRTSPGGRWRAGFCDDRLPYRAPAEAAARLNQGMDGYAERLGCENHRSMAARVARRDAASALQSFDGVVLPQLALLSRRP